MRCCACDMVHLHTTHRLERGECGFESRRVDLECKPQTVRSCMLHARPAAHALDTRVKGDAVSCASSRADGGGAQVTFLKSIKLNVEDPARMLLDL